MRSQGNYTVILGALLVSQGCGSNEFSSKGGPGGAAGLSGQVESGVAGDATVAGGSSVAGAASSASGPIGGSAASAGDVSSAGGTSTGGVPEAAGSSGEGVSGTAGAAGEGPNPEAGAAGMAGDTAAGGTATGGTATGGTATGGTATGGTATGGTATGGTATGGTATGGTATGGTASGGTATGGSAGTGGTPACTAGATQDCGTAEELGQCRTGSQVCLGGSWDTCVIEDVPDTDALACDDDNPLTSNETCSAGACVGTESSSLARQAIAVGTYHACAIRGGGTVYCWGRNDTGQLGSTSIDEHGPVAIAGVTDAVAISAGIRHTCALTVTGEVHCWGDNARGQLGHGDYTTQSPAMVPGLTAVTLAAGGYTTCAIDENAQAWCWGTNASGLLGVDPATLENSITPMVVHEDMSFLEMKPEFAATCGLTTDRDIYCWGWNYHGILGVDEATLEETPEPQPISSMSGVAGLDLGTGHACYRRDSGEIRCWGSNSSGELGREPVGADSPTPGIVSGVVATQVAASDGATSCARTTTGVILCWGSNYDGNLGNDDTSVAESTTPVPIARTADFVTVDVGGNGCARTSTGDVYCWGHGAYGALNGDIALTSSALPILVDLP